MTLSTTQCLIEQVQHRANVLPLPCRVEQTDLVLDQLEFPLPFVLIAVSRTIVFKGYQSIAFHDDYVCITRKAARKSSSRSEGNAAKCLYMPASSSSGNGFP